MENRNNWRLLNDQQIKDITKQVAEDLTKYSEESASTLVDHCLRGDAEGLLEIISNWIEIAEDKVIENINYQLNEDQYDFNIHPTDNITF